MTLRELSFVDLYIGAGYAEFTGLSGQAGITPAPADVSAEIATLRELCQRRATEKGENEFGVSASGCSFRVTMLRAVTAEIFVLRRTTDTVRPLTRIGLPEHVCKLLLAPDQTGLVLIAGEQAVGKTSTASSLLVERLRLHGGVSVAIEDPPEMVLDGRHGNGRCIQMAVDRKAGLGYRELLINAVRSGARCMLIGEIRDEATASEVIRASINGALIISTVHASSIPDAVDRVLSLYLQRGGHQASAAATLARGLTAIVRQTKDGARVRTQSLIVAGEHGVQTKIREGRITHIDEDVTSQAARTSWHDKA